MNVGDSEFRMRSGNGGGPLDSTTNRKNRDLLFGGRASAAGGTSIQGTGATREMEAMESENYGQVDNLMGKATQMKDLAIQIDSEVQGQNRMLDDMNSQFSNAGDLISGTMQKLNEMVNSDTGCKQLLLLAGGIVFILVLAYFLFHH